VSHHNDPHYRPATDDIHASDDLCAPSDYHGASAYNHYSAPDNGRSKS
jgi:hypothetical protein